MSDCKSCKGRYKECAGPEWYSPGDIRFCPYQVLWLIEWFFWLSKEGVVRIGMDWPEDPNSSGSELPNVQRSRVAGAYFEKPIDAIAELAIRLKNLGRSADLLLAELQAGMEGNLTDEADAAFHYITGNRRKLKPYYQWKAQRKWRRGIK